MKAMIDTGICIGCGLCTTICPEVFEMAGDTAVVRGETVPPGDEDSCREATDACPVTAITLQK